jgi:hypothetical protein
MGTFTKLLMASAAAFTLSAHADPIVIEPDDYDLGEQITSPFATVSKYNTLDPLPIYATYTNTSEGVFAPAPTGSLVFGPGYTRLDFDFVEDVSSIDILALNWGYNGLQLDCEVWYDDGELGQCSDDADYKTVKGETHLYSLSARDGRAFDRIQFGGYSRIGALLFDHLVAYPVPEPLVLELFLMGGVAAFLFRRRGRRYTLWRREAET